MYQVFRKYFELVLNKYNNRFGNQYVHFIIVKQQSTD